MDIDRMKVTPRDQQVLDLLVQGCSNKEIAGQLSISPRTVKQHLRTLFLRAGIREGRKRVERDREQYGKLAGDALLLCDSSVLGDSTERRVYVEGAAQMVLDDLLRCVHELADLAIGQSFPDESGYLSFLWG